MLILGFIAGLIHSIYFKITADQYLPYTMHSLATYSLRYFNTWVLLSLFLTILFLLIKIIWNLLLKNSPISHVNDKIQFYGSIFLGCTVGSFFFFYGGWTINHYLLPSKYHPLSLLCDIGIFIFSVFSGWVIINANRDHKFKDLLAICYKIAAFVLVLFLMGLNSYVFIHSKKTQENPNVIFILIDALRADHLSSYGYQRNTSPYIDSIAREGVLFRNAISSAPWTVPSVTSMFTSLYPSVHGVLKHSQTSMGMLNNDYVTLAELLLEGGYETAGIVSNPWLNRGININQGFKTYRMVDWKNASEVTSEALSWLDRRSSSPFLLSWLDKRPIIPFFLYVHYMDVHAPYNNVPQSYNRLFAENRENLFKRNISEEELKKMPSYWGIKDVNKMDLNSYITPYDQKIRFVDDEIKNLINKLETTDLLDNTLIVIVSDHGIQFLEHGRWDMGGNLHDENIHIPLIMKFPRKLPRNYIIDNQVRSIDIMPTLLEMLNFSAPDNINGESLLPLIYKKEKINLDAFSEAVYDYEDVNNKLIENINNQIQSLRTNEFKIIYDHDISSLRRGLYFYDLKMDSKESFNLTQNNKYKNQFERLYNRLNYIIKENNGLVKYYEKNQTVELNKETKDKLKSLGYIQ